MTKVNRSELTPYGLCWRVSRVSGQRRIRMRMTRIRMRPSKGSRLASWCVLLCLLAGFVLMGCDGGLQDEPTTRPAPGIAGAAKGLQGPGSVDESAPSLPPKPESTDGRRENSGRGVRELQGRWPGWGRLEVGGGSSVVAQGSYGRLRTLGRARWRGEDAARDTRTGWRELAG